MVFLTSFEVIFDLLKKKGLVFLTSFEVIFDLLDGRCGIEGCLPSKLRLLPKKASEAMSRVGIELGSSIYESCASPLRHSL